MGVAAYNRGSLSIANGLWSDINEQQKRDELIRMAEIAEECNIFVRAANDFLVEPKGLCKSTVEWSKTRRGYKKRIDAVINAHNAWVNSDYFNVSEYHCACVKRAKAVCSLFIFCLGSWVIPANISIPRAAK